MPSVDLLSPGRIDGFDTRNRMFMAPMTRSRALPGGVPSDLAIEYYGQRASAGLIITEGTAPAATGIGYARTPSIDTPEQIAGWKRITDAVHARRGRIFMQFMHVGRIAHSPIATSAIRPSRRRSSVPLARCGRTRSGCRTWTRRARSTRVRSRKVRKSGRGQVNRCGPFGAKYLGRVASRDAPCAAVPRAHCCGLGESPPSRCD